MLSSVVLSSKFVRRLIVNKYRYLWNKIFFRFIVNDKSSNCYKAQQNFENKITNMYYISCIDLIDNG